MDHKNWGFHILGKDIERLMAAPDFVARTMRICETAVRIGYQRAWAGFIDQDEKKLVHVVGHAGFDSGYFESNPISWGDEPGGQNLAGITIRTGQVQVARDVPGDRMFNWWRGEASRLGYKSVIALPLSGKGSVFGVLVIYDQKADAFAEREVKILTELSNDLAFGLTVLSPVLVRRQSAAEALEDSRRKLGQAERISRLAQWDRDLDTDIVTWSDELYRMLGLEPQQRKFHFLEFAKLIHPADRERIVKVAEDVKQSVGLFELDYRVIRPDGQLRYIHSEGEVIRDESGRPHRSVGWLHDVTEYVLAKAALEEANRSLELKNIAMQEVLTNIETERQKIGQRINRNVEQIILPLLNSLKESATRPQQRAIEQIDQSLKEIISPFADNIAHALNMLTPAEMRVCNHIKRGLAVKQIADLEHLSPETISAHRRNIRRKLKIAHRKINLATYLRDQFGDSTTSPR
ncbi:MAG TPA: PAS domain-containing protein [Tepidisphaeraceae bacterium]